ncbi:deoxyribodipyrimidine photo-lyase [Algivirga pacifica]|uniref:Deoxyribodipyrimidine photo-lyase n=1 Tax=Algivirga pacifica TaxID=1162670 RepID=A0ABP9D3G0_9BACT
MSGNMLGRKAINIVWIKRDLRTQDHAAFQAAENAGLPYIAFSLLEPKQIEHPDTSLRHLKFIYHAVKDINKILAKTQGYVHLWYKDAREVFSFLSEEFEIKEVFSYQESGTANSWERDKQMKTWFKDRGIIWTEFQRDGIIRGLHNRDGWEKAWYQTMNAPLIQNQYQTGKMLRIGVPFELSMHLKRDLENYSMVFQPAGESHGWKYLYSFTEKRGFDYHLAISSPSKSRMSCSRISPYLSWGNLSIKQVYQYIKNHPNRYEHKKAFNAVLTRLKWHCHFIQKFEMECRYETECINRGYDLLTYENNPELLEAWKHGRTGYPMVDACMRALIATGWINFRMRAMLVSFLCHRLDQDWRKGAYHLAQLFLDYEPGIHYPQFQMQAGVTGINTVRIYNPVKQSKEQDAEGRFIKKWVPELSRTPKEYLHEPWRMTSLDALFQGMKNKSYPDPIIDLETTGKRARKKFWSHKNHPLVREEAARIIEMHTKKN